MKDFKENLRRHAIYMFRCTCQYCDGVGDYVHGPDGRSWHLDRVFPGVLGGEYESDNVTLSCATCNNRKKDKTGEHDERYDIVISLAELEVISNLRSPKDHSNTINFEWQ